MPPEVLFRGLRVRMSIVTGTADAVRLHSVTQRNEYLGEVLQRVQALTEAPRGGQVGCLCLWFGSKGRAEGLAGRAALCLWFWGPGNGKGAGSCHATGPWNTWKRMLVPASTLMFLALTAAEAVTAACVS